MTGSLRVVLAAITVCIWLVPVRADARHQSQPLVDLHGDPLPPLAVQRLGTTRFVSGGMEPLLVPSPDSKLLATAGGNSVNVWELKSGRLIQRFDSASHNAVIFFNPDCQSIFTHTHEVGLHEWDLRSGKKLCDIETGKLWLKSACIGPDGHTVALNLAELVAKGERGVGLYRHWVELRDARTNKILKKFGELDSPLTRMYLAYSADGKSLLGLETNEVYESVMVRWDPATGKELSRLPFKELTHHPQFTPDQKYFAYFSWGPKTWKGLHIWDLEVGKPLTITPPKGFGGNLSNFVLAPDGKRALAVTPGSSISLGQRNVFTEGQCIYWAIEEGKIISKIERHHTALPRLFTPDGKALLGNTSNGLIQQWDAATGQHIPGPVGHQGPVGQLTWAPDSNRIASGSDAVLIWDVKTGKELVNVAKIEGYGMRFMDKGKRLAVLNENRSQVIDAMTNDLRTIPAMPMFQDRTVMNFAVSPDGNFLAVTTNAGSVGWPGVISEPRLHVWDVAGKRQLGNWKIPHYPAATFGPTPLAFVPKSVQLVFAKATSTEKNPGSTLVLWDFARGRETKEIGTFAQCPSEIFFTPDGKTLITRELTGMIRLWDLASGKERLSFQPYEKSTMWRMDLSPDGKLIATGDHNSGHICFWELATGKKIGQLNTTQGGVGCIGFSPNGKFIASGGRDTTILIWDLAKVLESIRKQ